MKICLVKDDRAVTGDRLGDIVHRLINLSVNKEDGTNKLLVDGKENGYSFSNEYTLEELKREVTIAGFNILRDRGWKLYKE